jgi:hypothetical protein
MLRQSIVVLSDIVSLVLRLDSPRRVFCAKSVQRNQSALSFEQKMRVVCREPVNEFSPRGVSI